MFDETIELSQEPIHTGSGLDAHKVLVLNADFRPISYYPLSTVHWQQVMFLHVKGMNTGIPRFHIVEYYDKYVHCGLNQQGEQSVIQLPSVVAHLKYLTPPKKVPMTRTNVLLRDNFTCQYSREKCFESELTWDHVVPASNGGGTTWENIVSAKQKINELKDNMSLKDFEKFHGYTLRAMPHRPTWGELYEAGKKHPPKYLHETWKDYLHWEV